MSKTYKEEIEDQQEEVLPDELIEEEDIPAPKPEIKRPLYGKNKAAKKIQKEFNYPKTGMHCANRNVKCIKFYTE